MFSMYCQYQANITGIELYIEFEEVAAAEVEYEAAPYLYGVTQHHEEVVLRSNPMSKPCYILLIFLFNDFCLLASS